MSDPGRETRETYERIADTYFARRQDRSSVSGFLDQFVDGLTGDRVLDVGCGPGFETKALADRGLRAVGFDLSLSMLRVSKSTYGCPVVQGDMRHLPFLERFDGVWACASLLHLPRADAPAALRSFHDALRAGGLLYVAVKRGIGEGIDTKPFGEPRFFTYWQDEPFDREIAAAGFEIVQGLDVGGPEDLMLQRYARKCG